MLLVRLVYAAAVMALAVWLLRTGKPLGGLLLVPLAAVWLRREAETGRLLRSVQRVVYRS